MKAFLAASVAMAAIAVGAHYGLDLAGMSAKDVFQGDAVRLDN